MICGRETCPFSLHAEEFEKKFGLEYAIFKKIMESGSDKFNGLNFKLKDSCVGHYKCLDKTSNLYPVLVSMRYNCSVRERILACLEADDLFKLRELVEKNSYNIFKRGRGDGKYLIHHAAMHNAIKCVSYLLMMGADVNVSTKSKNTPLHLAIYNGCNEVALILVANRAMKNITNRWGETANFLIKKNQSANFRNILILSVDDCSVLATAIIYYALILFYVFYCF